MSLDIVLGGWVADEPIGQAAVEEARGIMRRYRQATAPAHGSTASSPDFDPDDEEAIEATLRDPDPNNPIAQALARRIKELAGLYWRAAEESDRTPADLPVDPPQTAFERIAVRLTRQVLAEARQDSAAGAED